MSTLRINNIEAQSIPASPTLDEKVKITNSSGDILVNIDGKTSGITTIGINTTDGNIKFDENSNIVVTGIITATKFVGLFEPEFLEIGSNIKLGNAGVITATSFVGNGSGLTGISGVSVANQADNRLLTATGTTDALNSEANLTFDGATLAINSTTGFGLPKGTTAQEPSSSSGTVGHLRYNTQTEVVYYNDGTSWKKIAPTFPTLSSVSGSIIDGAASTLTLTGTGFLSANLVVNFVQSSDGININVTVTPSSDTAATVAVPASVYNNVTAGNAVTIKVTNSDGQSSGDVSTNAIALPSGGSITTSGGYRIHTFTSSGTFVNTIANNSVQYLVVAGGGGGGNTVAYSVSGSSGGGAGGYRSNVTGQSSGGGASAEAALTLSAGSYTVTIGGGGGGTSSHATGGNGNNSVFGSITSIGGGGGGGGSGTAGNGGSGGGKAYSGGVGSGTAGQGYDGGNHGERGGGGGGGASAVGQSRGGGEQNGGAGGAGVSSNINGSATTRAGGGGGSGSSSGSGGSGGSGGGGNGTGNSGTGGSGSTNKGGGGGGTGPGGGTSGSGGSGIVIVRYAI